MVTFLQFFSLTIHFQAKARATNKSMFGRYLNDKQELIVSEKG